MWPSSRRSGMETVSSRRGVASSMWVPSSRPRCLTASASWIWADSHADWRATPGILPRDDYNPCESDENRGDRAVEPEVVAGDHDDVRRHDGVARREDATDARP